MKFYPEPIWALHLNRERLEQGESLRIEPNEIIDYSVDPYAAGWEGRYAPSAIERRKALGFGSLPPTE